MLNRTRLDDFDNLGADWLHDAIDKHITTGIEHIGPVAFNEQNRYLPQGVTPTPGYIRFNRFPFWIEPLECFDVRSSVREVNILKGVQVGYTTLLESVMFYLIAYIKTQPGMYITADKELANLRMEMNILPMLNESDMSHLIRSADVGNTRKTGKALALDTLIPTPSGLTPMKNLSVGSTVFAPDGKAVRVITESPEHYRQCYEVAFANGEKIIASDDHRWEVFQRDSGRRIRTTKYLHDKGLRAGKDYRFRVAVPAPVKNRRKSLPVAPYTLGAWLGDGSSQDPMLSVGKDSHGVLDQVESDGYELKKYKTHAHKCALFAIKSTDSTAVRTHLRRMNLLLNKHIPEKYQSSCVDDRLRLLQGLMDTDGYCSKRGECEITQKNERLARDIWRLVNSLGYKATVSPKKAKSQNGTESTVFRVKFFADKTRPPFTLSYKVARLKEKLHVRSSKNTIVSVRPVGRRKVKCIGVDHPSELYLCGAGHIPTHNTKDYLQWDGGGFLVYQGAQNAAKMRQTSVPYMLKDELDGWPRAVGQDGDSDTLTDARLSAYWSQRKILRGSTPLLEPSMISDAYDKGDKREYRVLCKHCSFAQPLRLEAINKETGVVGGFHWETEQGRLILESVRWCCVNCGKDHYEYDKERLFDPAQGAEWVPTAVPKESGIRSYQLPSFYSPVGFRPWSKCISDYLDAYDSETKTIISIAKYQEFYNNTLGRPFKTLGMKVRFESVSAHRRPVYRFGQIPNKYANEHAMGRILFLTCQVDVHKNNLAVSVMGWTLEMRCFVIDYWRFEVPEGADDCSELTSPVWGRLRELIEEKVYVADDKQQYRVMATVIDAGYANDTVTGFCSDYAAGVYPVLGRDRPGKHQRIKEFNEFTAQDGTTGYTVVVDHYKDRLAPVLRRVWREEQGPQNTYHFNAPVDMTDTQLKELTVESRKEKTDDRTGEVTYFWYRPGNARNELWDLLGYGHALVEIIAWKICIDYFEVEQIDWGQFWEYANLPENDQLFGRVAADA